eukprot:TRINITY_DN15651_c0_g2_i1.p1 TRINITY_DN15651_c0_g2~~TRINITY_DN15651_c0_g2_i1.p1  ORF type:complete len:199 (+),score=26.19 TRINITY_DN15651_c0_g2_i1:92-688(+)
MKILGGKGFFKFDSNRSGNGLIISFEIPVRTGSSSLSMAVTEKDTQHVFIMSSNKKANETSKKKIVILIYDPALKLAMNSMETLLRNEEGIEVLALDSDQVLSHPNVVVTQVDGSRKDIVMNRSSLFIFLVVTQEKSSKLESVMIPILDEKFTRSRYELMKLDYVAHTNGIHAKKIPCLLYTSPSPRDRQKSRMPSSA